MSASQVQTAILQLVYLPEQFRGSQLDQFLGKFDLTEEEKWQVRAVAASPLVTKFGKDQREKRILYNVKKFLPNTFLAAGEGQKIENFFAKYYEPSPESHVDDTETCRAFVEFCVKNQDKFFESGLSTLLLDLMQVEYFDSALKIGERYFDWKVPDTSLLNPEAFFEILELRHDVPEFLEKIDGMDKELIPQTQATERPVLLLMVRTPSENPENMIIDQFEIDESLKTFLESQKLGESSPKPECFEELVDLGLCRNLQ